MSGLLALIGGREHTSGCEEIDRTLLAECGTARPDVTVLLAATRQGKRPYKIAEAKDYWRQFRVRLRIGYSGRPDDHEHSLELLENPDLVVLTGGYPWLLHQRLGGTPVLERILELWRSGVPLSGSSAGAMAFCQWRPQLLSPDPLRLVDGFGLVPGTAMAPHFEHFDMIRVARMAVRRYPDLLALGIPNRTALVGRRDSFRVVGRGSVWLVRRELEQSFPSGATLALHTRARQPRRDSAAVSG